MSAFDLLRQVDRDYKVKKKADESKIFIPTDIANTITEKVNNALSRKDLANAGAVINGIQYPYTGDVGLENLIEDSYKNFYDRVTPKEGFRIQAGVSYKGISAPKTQFKVQLGNLETAHMLRLKKAYENLEQRMVLKRKSDALKRKSDKLTLNQRNIAKLKDGLFVIISRIENKQY